MAWPGWLKRIVPGEGRRQLALTVAGMTGVFWGVFLFAPDMPVPSGENWNRLLSYVPTVRPVGQDRTSSPEGSEGGAAFFRLCYSGGGTNCVVDGDTFWFQGQKIRMADIDAPETHPSRCAHEADLGQRANIDEFTETTARAIESVGGADKGKAIIILNPAEPPMIMRDTVFTLSSGAGEKEIETSILAMVEEVRSYVPGFRLKQDVQFERFGSNNPVHIPGIGDLEGIKTSVFLEVEGAAHYLPSYAGNLDIMTSAAFATARRIAAKMLSERVG